MCSFELGLFLFFFTFHIFSALYQLYLTFLYQFLLFWRVICLFQSRHRYCHIPFPGWGISVKEEWQARTDKCFFFLIMLTILLGLFFFLFLVVSYQISIKFLQVSEGCGLKPPQFLNKCFLSWPVKVMHHKTQVFSMKKHYSTSCISAQLSTYSSEALILIPVVIKQ